MSEELQLQLGSAKNVDGVVVDQNFNINLTSSTKELLSYNESSVISVSDLFNAERQESESYRVYGNIDFLSNINGLKRLYKKLPDFFFPPRLGEELSGVTKNLLTCFDVYLCYPSTGHTALSVNTFIRNYTVVTKLSNAEVYKAGFARNIFFNYEYAFDFNMDFNIEGAVDSFKKPYTNFYLFFDFHPNQNGNSQTETVSQIHFTGPNTPDKTIIPILAHPPYNPGQVLEGDRVIYVDTNFEEELKDQMEYYVLFPYDLGNLQFKYNPFIPLKIRDYGDETITANATGGTENDLIIPSYAVKVDNRGNYIWKDLLPNGYIDPISGRGVDYPFVNKRHYLFNNIVLPLNPDLNHPNTNAVFGDILFGPNSLVNKKPSSNLNNLGNRCA